MTGAGSGMVSSKEYNGATAADRLVDDALDDGDLESADFAFLFCSVEFDLDPFIDQLDARLSDLGADWVGCTTVGELSDTGPTAGCAVLLLVESDDVSFTVSVADNIHDHPEESGEAAVEDILETWELNGDTVDDSSDRDRALHAMLAGQTFTREEVGFDILQGIVRKAPDLPIVGGGAGDDLRMHQTYQFHNGEIYEDALILTGIASDHRIVTGMENGLHDKMASGVVTSSDGCVIEEINGEPAATFYADAIDASLRRMKLPAFFPEAFHPDEMLRYLYLLFTGKTNMKLQHIVKHAMDHSMAIEMGSDNYRIITPMTITDDGGIVVKTPVPENNAIHVVEGDDDDVVNAARNIFTDIGEDSDPLFCIVSDCVWRRLAFTDDEQASAVEQLVNHVDCPVIGYYGNGEIGGNSGSFCTFHNQSVSGFAVTRDTDE